MAAMESGTPINDVEPGGTPPEASVEELQHMLEEADPAEAPEIAESIAVRLGRDLDDEETSS